MDDVPIHKIQISGPALASLLLRFSSSPGAIHGLLFGHVTVSATSSLSDDPTSNLDPSSADADAGTAIPLLTATVTSFLSLPSHLPLPLQPLPNPNPPSSSLLGWFSARRRTPLRPSLNDSTTTHALSSSTSLSFTPPQCSNLHTLTLPPSLFLLLTSPLQDQLVHTHQYKAFHYRISTDSFEPKSLDIVNIGPSFRSHYGSFSTNSPFPLLPCEWRCSNAMAEDDQRETLGSLKKDLNDQKELDLCAEDFEVGRLNRLMGSQAANYTAELEDLYNKMLAKLDGLSRLVENSSAKVLEQILQY
ncbi:uncharacterized protein [Coffea arabica]|uniref:Uncharacterized protein isoform X2 n=1 Tax=Coffea arabica TaxID=13443 RepID=A0ABM4USN4_COFAR